MNTQPLITVSVNYPDDGSPPGCQMTWHAGHEGKSYTSEWLAWMLACCARDFAEDIAKHSKLGPAEKEQIEAYFVERFNIEMQNGEHQITTPEDNT